MSTDSHVAIPNPRKRGRDRVDEKEADARRFTIRPDSSDPWEAQRAFAPLCLLSRAQLPLAYLDTASSGSRLFAAHINALESAHDHDDDTTVLVATETQEKKLYAIERVKRRVYALCQLGGWVKEAGIVAQSHPVRWRESHPKRRVMCPEEGGKPWWTSAAVHQPEISTAPSVAKLKFDMRASISEPRSTALPVCEDQPSQTRAKDTCAEQEDLNASVQTPTEVTQELTRQYLEALYLSRTSLAYFTKGPLSRARAACAAMPHPTATSELASFLRESVLASTAMDKKYKDGISLIVKELPTQALDSSEQRKKAKRKRKWKSKRDKQGFFVDEKDIVGPWWREHDDQPGSSSGETVDQTLRRRLSKLRSRETLLQLILILEILALESSLPTQLMPSHESQAESTGESQAAEMQQEGTQADTGERKSKPKKKQDLPALLETLLDKLCIWHSLEANPPLKQVGACDQSQDQVNDDLKGFCVEVIIPFYISRTPHHANNANKKLGGPSAPTPLKPRSTAARKPGEPAVRHAPDKKPRKPLARVSTDTLNQHARRVPSLNRSATDTDALSSCIKRETSEIPMDLIPALNRSRTSRQSLVHTLDSSQRQIDLSAMTQANKIKLQKKADTDASIESAINMFRKPSREAAVAEIRVQTDERFVKAIAAAKSKSHLATQRAKNAQRTHVTNTPSHRRTVKATPYRRAADVRETWQTHSSGTTHVASSSARLAQTQELAPSSSFAIPQTGHRPRYSALAGASGVEETPSRGFAKFMPTGLARQPGTLDSPSASRKVAATPLKPVRSLSLGVGATATVTESSNVQPGGDGDADDDGGGAGPKSIYDALGWEEDEYEALA